MKHQVSICIACAVLSCALTAPAQIREEIEKREEARQHKTFEMIERVTAPNDIPRDLDTLLAMAVAFSPQTRQARAELDAIRIQIVRDVSTAFAQRERSIEYLLSYPDEVERYKNIPNQKLGYNASHASTLRESEETLRALTGLTLNQFPRAGVYIPVRPMRTLQTLHADQSTRATIRTPNAFPEPKHLESILDQTVSIVFEDIDLVDMLEFISETYEINFITDIGLKANFPHVNLKNISLRHALEALADSHGELAFVMRDYGIFVTFRDRAIRVPGATIPNDIPYLAPTPPGQIQSGFGGGGGGRLGAGGGGGRGRGGGGGGGLGGGGGGGGLGGGGGGRLGAGGGATAPPQKPNN